MDPEEVSYFKIKIIFFGSLKITLAMSAYVVANITVVTILNYD